MFKAAQSAWPYARRSAWSYLHDESMAAELLERAIEQIFALSQAFYLAAESRKGDSPATQSGSATRQTKGASGPTRAIQRKRS